MCSKVHAFMGPLHKYITKPHVSQNFFLTYPGYEPLVFLDEPFKFNFFKNRVFFAPLLQLMMLSM